MSDEPDPVKIVLEPFARSSIESRFGADLDRGAQAALRHYARRVRSRRVPPEVPVFMRDVGIDLAQATELDVPVPYEVQAALTRESRLQDVPLDRIVAHAVFVYLSDIETVIERGGPAGAKEADVESRSPSHAPIHSTTGTRRRGAAASGSNLRGRSRGARGRSRFGKR